jgi:saccharopine dehydrogenase-like NADP-dependent oxidoreductase
MKIPTMVEKTLRYPGHKTAIQILKQAGYFSNNAVDINGIKIKPVDLSAKLLFPLWKLEENEPEFTYMQLNVKGKENHSDKEYEYKLFDRFDDETKTSSMARTTGYTCTAVANLVLNGEYKRKGISPPEYVGEDENCYTRIIKHLKERNLILKTT